LKLDNCFSAEELLQQIQHKDVTWFAKLIKKDKGTGGEGL